MAVSYPKMGNKVIAKVIGKEGNCTIGLEVGDEFELSIHRCGDFCGYFYHNLFGIITILQFGGSFPVMVWECPNGKNKVKVELRVEKQ